jgi:hypothetical protein
MLPPSSWIKCHTSTENLEAACSSEMTVSSSNTALCYSPEYINLRAKTSIYIYIYIYIYPICFMGYRIHQLIQRHVIGNCRYNDLPTGDFTNMKSGLTIQTGNFKRSFNLILRNCMGTITKVVGIEP